MLLLLFKVLPRAPFPFSNPFHITHGAAGTTEVFTICHATAGKPAGQTDTVPKEKQKETL